MRSLASGIAFGSLPRTYQDAVIVSRSLGFRYLWIDALCIIQNDKQDWLQEAAKMASVYHQSSCTISTHAASDDDHRFLNLKHRREGNISLLVTASHLSQRGWVFQERILSKRLLRFTSKGLFLEDASGFKKPDGKTPATDFYDPWKDNKQNLEDSHHDPCGWYRLIERFTACRLTFDTDRLPAVMGLAQLSMQSLDDGGYLWGLWSRSIHQGLLWINVDEEARKLAHEPGSANKAAPSWSWGSWTGRIKFPDRLSSFKAEFTLVDPKTETSNNGRDIAEPVPRAAEQDPPYMMLKMRITRLQNLNFVLRSRISRLFMGVDFYYSMTDKGLDWASLDGETDKQDIKFDQVTLALVAHHHNIETFTMEEDLVEEHIWSHYFLLLSPFENDNEMGQKYRRVGVAASTWLFQSSRGAVSRWEFHSARENMEFSNSFDHSTPVIHPKARDIFEEAELATIMLY